MYTFSKRERLCSKRLIGEVFASAQRMTVYPLGWRWKVYDSATLEAPVQVVIVAPKRKLHHAVDRNRAKRLMRECWRKRKAAVAEEMESHGKSLALSMSYLDSSICSQAQLGARMDKAIAQLIRQLQEMHSVGLQEKGGRE